MTDAEQINYPAIHNDAEKPTIHTMYSTRCPYQGWAHIYQNHILYSPLFDVKNVGSLSFTTKVNCLFDLALIHLHASNARFFHLGIVPTPVNVEASTFSPNSTSAYTNDVASLTAMSVQPYTMDLRTWIV